ncbi:MAG: hypothetical protein K9J81_10705, partial [Desulfohalobiaceae bacterium]|nr:hypothetical protein [Desulfohalobiaceae bacterium]
SCYKQEDPFDGTEHTFDPIELTGLVPEYSVNVMLPDLDLQDRFESPIVVFAKKMSDKDRVVHLSLEYQPQDPCGVEYPDTITIPAGKMFAEGMLRFSSTSCGNNHASGVLQGHIGGVSYPSGPIEFSNLIMLPEGAIYSPFLASLNTWSYCERKARPDNRVLPARFTEGPCETSGLVFHVCKGPGVGFYFPHKCSFSFTTDCRIVQTNLQVPTYQLQRTFITGCQTMKFIADKPLHQGGGWQIVKGFKRVCVYTPAGRNGNITVDDCVTV